MQIRPIHSLSGIWPPGYRSWQSQEANERNSITRFNIIVYIIYRRYRIALHPGRVFPIGIRSFDFASHNDRIVVFPNGNAAPLSESTPLSSDAVMMSTQQIGDLVRQRRLVNGLTQRKLSELAGVGLRLVSELERGKATLRMDSVNRVLRVFGLMLGAVPLPRPATDTGDTP